MSDIKIAKLTDEQFEEIQNLEKKLGVNLVAYLTESNEYASLSKDNLESIKELEKKLGIVLLAYPKNKAA